jgi:RNA polymerase sigma-B factor
MGWRIVATQSQPQKQDKNPVYELLRKYQEEVGNQEEIQTQIVTMYKGLVIALARKYSKGQSLHDDLVQVGMIGLLAAIRRYDAEIGKSFESFAIPTIIGEIKRFIRDKTWSVHVPRRIKELNPKIKKAVETLTNDLGRSPKVVEIAKFIDADEEQVLEAMEMGRSYRALSVDSTIESDAEGSTLTLLDLVGNKDSGYENIDHQLLIEKAFEVLNERESEILKNTYLHNMSQKEVGDRLGISQMHVSRLQRRAILKLREAIRVNAEECSK